MIYFIRAQASGAIKIGYTGNDPEKRLASLQTGSPEPLSLMGSIDGGLEEERRLHDRFAQYRLHGEWFRPDPALVHHIKASLVRVSLSPAEWLEHVGFRLWVIEGQAFSDGGGGPTTLVCVWHRRYLLPDPRSALEAVAPGYVWGNVERIVDLTDHPAAWPLDGETYQAMAASVNDWDPTGGWLAGLAWDTNDDPGQFAVVEDKDLTGELKPCPNSPAVCGS